MNLIKLQLGREYIISLAFIHPNMNILMEIKKISFIITSKSKSMNLLGRKNLAKEGNNMHTCNCKISVKETEDNTSKKTTSAWGLIEIILLNSSH